MNYMDQYRYWCENDYFDDGITRKGYDFLDSHPLNYYEKYHMDMVDYTDFEKYFYSHSEWDEKTICINYLKEFGDDEDIMEIIFEINTS